MGAGGHGAGGSGTGGGSAGGAAGGAGGAHDASTGDATDADDASGDGPLSCNTITHCPAGQACIMGGACAQSCTIDGGTDASDACPAGTTCQHTNGFCEGTACAAIQVTVCR
jgi:hypothetical protein